MSESGLPVPTPDALPRSDVAPSMREMICCTTVLTPSVVAVLDVMPSMHCINTCIANLRRMRHTQYAERCFKVVEEAGQDGRDVQ